MSVERCSVKPSHCTEGDGAALHREGDISGPRAGGDAGRFVCPVVGLARQRPKIPAPPAWLRLVCTKPRVDEQRARAVPARAGRSASGYGVPVAAARTGSIWPGDLPACLAASRRAPGAVRASAPCCLPAAQNGRPVFRRDPALPGSLPAHLNSDFFRLAVGHLTFGTCVAALLLYSSGRRGLLFYYYMPGSARYRARPGAGNSWLTSARGQQCRRLVSVERRAGLPASYQRLGRAVGEICTQKPSRRKSIWPVPRWRPRVPAALARSTP